MDHSPSLSGNKPLSDVGSPALAYTRTAIVTGASSGIGRSIALALAEAGVGLVVCADVRIQPLIEGVGVEKPERKTHEEIEKRFGAGRARFVKCDVTVERTGSVTATDEDHEGPACGMAELVERTVGWTGRVDMWVPPSLHPF